MSIKDLFSKTNKVISAENAETLGEEVESERYLAAENEEQQRFEPHVDYGEQSNFAFFGSAEKYYTDAFNHIYQFYPYDGSRAEQHEFLNQSNNLTRYIFDSKYPRSTGYGIFSAVSWGTPTTKVVNYGAPNTSADYEYITIVGGPHTASNGMENVSLATSFSASNIYSSDIYVDNGLLAGDRIGSRLSNLRFYPTDGTTIEFWLKKDAFNLTNTNKEVIFDLWNGEASSSAGYGRFTFELSGTEDGTSPFRLTYQSGTNGVSNVSIGASLTTSSVADGTWNHYAVTVKTGSAGLETKLYVNGDLNDSTAYAASTYNMGEITGSLKAFIGALQTSPSGNIYDSAAIGAGWGKFSGSLDEFRYWKGQRSSQDIGRNWFTQVRGGSNSDVSNADLGVYYKFNEGITNTSSLDSVVLDYSGRISNGVWTGYNVSSRNTGSAILSASAASIEFEDPIMRSEHELFSTRKLELEQSGSLHDQDNNASLLYSLPEWILEENREAGDGSLENLVQMVGGYFDDLYLLIKEMPQIKNVKYFGSGSKPYPFSRHLLQNFGLVAPEIFVDANVMQQFLSRDEDREYTDTLTNTKNLIYQNIYNNLVYIFKSKGTEKSFRNLLRCYGVSDELINFNTYADNNTFTFDRRFRSVSISKKYVDFYDPDKFESTVYQFSDPGNSSTVSFISGSGTDEKEDYLGVTVEGEVFFPKRLDKRSPHHFYFGSTTSSFFGMHGADGATPTDTTWPASDSANFQVLAVRPDNDSDDLYFMVTASNAPHVLPRLTSSLYKGVYNNQKWNLAVTISPTKLAGRVTGSSDTTYDVKFTGINMEGDIVQNEFNVTGTMSNAGGIAMLRSDKRLYLGANRTNFTGSTVYSADSRVSSLRYWAQALPTEVIRDHARDPLNAGSQRPFGSAFLQQTSLSGTMVPNIDTLALHWDFSNVTGSSKDAGDPTSKDSTFFVDDVSSGSVGELNKYGWFDNVVRKQHSGKGDFFLPPESGDTNPVDKTYLTAYRQQLPEIISSADTINILNEDDKNFARDKDVVRTFDTIEKSMYQIISKEMINMFASIVDFNNIIGEPVNRYRQEYKDLAKLRQLFFERVRNTPNLDKYLDFYKWLDSSINMFLQQLIPASANTSENIRNIVESHVLERNKVQTKFPTVEFKIDDPEFGMRGIEELTYNWKFGHAPVSGKEADHAEWWRERAQRDQPTLKTSDTPLDDDKESIRKVINTYRDPKSVIVSDDSTQYSGSVFALRRFTKPYRLTIKNYKGIRGGTNFHPNKDLYFARHAVYPAGPIRSDATYALLPLNTMVVDRTDKVYDLPDINDVHDPNKLKKIDSKVLHGRDFEEGVGYSIRTGDQALPFNIISSSVTTGYNKRVVEHFRSGTALVNIHHDMPGPEKETPMQGPFTERWVGGLQYRHINVNRGANLDTNNTRPEGFVILIGKHPDLPPDSSGTLGIVGPDYPHPNVAPFGPAYPSYYPKATFTRDGVAKRPINIANIRYGTSSVSFGNFEKTYEVVSLTGRKENNLYFKDNGGITLPSKIRNEDNLKETTNVNTLVGIGPVSNSPGNVAIGPFTTFPISYIRGSRFINNGAAVTQYTLPDRNQTKAVIASRFSAPGGFEVLSRGYLDMASEEYSVYNAMSFRNLSVLGSSSGEASYMRMDTHLSKRDGLRTLQQRHAGRFGLDSAYGTVSAENYDASPSFQKIHRNRLRRIEYSGTGIADMATASVRDNFYVQHAIPRSDTNYAWISRSVGYETQRMVGGYSPADGMYSASADGFDSAITFLTASEVGSYIVGSRKFGRDRTHLAPHFIPTDFVGLNTHIVNTMTTGSNILGVTTNVESLMNTTFIASLDSGDEPELFNSMLLNRGSLSGFSTWRQTRNSYHPLVRNERKNNRLSLIKMKPDAEYIVHADGSKEYLTPRYAPLQVFDRVMPVSKRYASVKQTVLANVDGVGLTPITLESAYGNSLSYFDNEDLDNLLAPSETPRLPYHSILESYLGTTDKTSLNLISGVESVFYSEMVYPSAINMYTTRIRQRDGFDNRFWRDSSDTRINNGSADRNSFGYIRARSSWPLDARNSFLTGTAVSTNSAAGELQNTHTQTFKGQAALNLRVGPLYARKHCLASYKSVVSPAGIHIPQTASIKANTVDERDTWLGRIEDRYFGDALWEAGNLAGKFQYTVDSSQLKVKGFTSQSLNPWYDSYDDFLENLRPHNEDYSLVPEFRISRHIEDIADSGDLNLELPDMFEVHHASTASAVPQNSSDDNFYTIFTNADFMKKFGAVREDHDGVLQNSKISLTCKVLKKFVPYDGFYPAQRTLQMATRLSKSYGANISPLGAQTSVSNLYYRPFIQPLYAPGIMFNSIKSGLAVDYPMFLTGSKKNAANVNNASGSSAGGEVVGYTALKTATLSALNVGDAFNPQATPVSSQDYLQKLEAALQQTDTTLSIISGSFALTERWDMRVPFEAIVEPEKYIKGLKLIDHEIDNSASVSVKAYWDGQGDNLYKLMTSNFLAEVPEFFLKDSGFTSLKSAGIPKTGMDFVSGSIWGARIKIRRTMNKSRTWEFEHGSSSVAFENWTYSGSFEVPQDPKSQVGLHETFTMYSRPTAFGPAVFGRTSGKGDGSRFEYTVSASVSGALDSFEGCNWAYTPPYYHGESWADIIFEPNRTGAYTVEEFFNEARTIMWRVDAGIEDPRPTTNFWETGSANDNRVKPTGSAQPQLVPNNTAEIAGKAEMYSGRNINANAMQLDASFNLFGLKKVNELGGSVSPAADYWVIEPKFETPMLNFGSSGSLRPISVADGTLTLPLVGSESVPRGMWHQFGLLPAEKEGIYIEMDDIPKSWLQYHPSLSYDERYGKKDVYDGIPGQPAVNSFSGDEAAKLNRLLLPDRLESLTTKFGFTSDQKSKRLGEVSDSKLVREAVVAVPFMQTEDGRQFFSIDKNLVQAAIDREVNGVISTSTAAGESINQMIRSMKNYVIPPTMNFIDNSAVEPFAMYVFEFEHKFTKEDLANIWQNLPPFDYKKVSEETSTISHNLGTNELLGSTGFEDKTQWMVFKVKQKARTNYFDKVSTSRGGTELKVLEQNPNVSLSSVRGVEKVDPKVGNDSVSDYSYNWPYDYFSTIEMANIGAGVELGTGTLIGPPATAVVVDPTEPTGVTTAANPLNLSTVAATSVPTVSDALAEADVSTPTSTTTTASPLQGPTIKL